MVADGRDVSIGGGHWVVVESTLGTTTDLAEKGPDSTMVAFYLFPRLYHYRYGRTLRDGDSRILHRLLFNGLIAASVLNYEHRPQPLFLGFLNMESIDGW